MSKDFIANLPEKFTRHIVNLHGAKGKRWLAALPLTAAEICGEWSIKIENIFPNLSFNFVAACHNTAGEKFVLKIGVPEKDSSIIYEHRTLQTFGGQGAVKLLKFDAKRCAMLLERAVEGKTLHEVCGEDYRKAVEIAVELMKKLPRNVPDKRRFINLESWIKGLRRAVKANFEPAKVAQAQKFFGELGEPFAQKILLHGDIHFDNILSARREPFLLIDPKGIIGEIGYEIAVFLNDLADWTSHLANRKKILDDAVKKFAAAFAVDAQSLRKWAFAFAVLSAWWMMEDFGENKPEYILRAEIWQV